MGVDLSRNPYYDDFSANSNYYKVLFRPAVAVQTRELNQLQTILQDQIAKFGRNILKDGTIVEGCPFSIDNRYTYVKINDNYTNGTAFTISSFENFYVQNMNGLTALVVNTVEGFQSQDPNTNVLYIKYVNSVVSPNGSQQSVFANSETLTLLTSGGIPVGNVAVFTPNTANPESTATGMGYAFSCGAGTIFKDNYFISVEPQTCIVDPFFNFPDGLSVGFLASENIITPEANSQLDDNSVGSPNYAAPGAHRYQLLPQLVVMQSNAITNSTPFFTLASFQDGAPITIKQVTAYAVIGAEMARRTYETNGDFIVNPFLLTTEPKSTGDPNYGTQDNLVCSSGLGYVKGYRAQYLNQVTTSLPKALSYVNVAGTATTVSFGSYVTVHDYCGDFNTTGLQQIELHSANNYAVTNGTFLTTPYSISTLIGTAFIRGLSYVDGAIGTGHDHYEAYLFNVNMNPGYAFAQVNGLVLRNNANTQTLALADCNLIANGPLYTTQSTSTQTQAVSNVIVSYTQEQIPNYPAILEDTEGGALPNGNIICVGGFTIDGPSSQQVFTYSPNNNTWTILPSYPIPVGLGGVTLSGSVVYSGGGCGNVTTNTPATVNYYCYNPAANSWTQIASSPLGVTNFGLATMANGSILQVGGQQALNATCFTTANCYRYDPGANTWTQVASLPTALNGQGCAPLTNGSILSVAGRKDVGSANLSNLCYRYDPGANTWTQVANYPANDCNMVAAQITNGNIIGITGVTYTSYPSGGPTQNCYTYDPVGNTWSQIASMPVQVAENGCAPFANGSVLSFTGITTWPLTALTGVQNCYMYEPVANIWTQSIQVPSFTTISNVVTITVNVYSTAASNVAVLIDANYDKLIYPTGRKALKLDGFNNQSFVYRDRVNASFTNTAAGSMSITLGAPTGTASENFDSGGFLSGQATDTFVVVPTQIGFTANKTGTVNATANFGNIAGNSTTFLTDYSGGDFIYVNSTLAQINVIFSNILMSLTQPFSGITALVNTHAKAFPKGVPIPFDNNGSHGGNRSITVSGNTATITIGEALSGAFNATAYFDVLRSYTVPIKKQYNQHVFVSIECSTHPNGTAGPFSLGFADVTGINAIYVSNAALSNTTPDYSPLFDFDNGQRDGFYSLAAIMPKSSFLSPSDNILVDLNVYTYNQSQGVGFFTANSYPVDDANTANTTAIQTQYIPVYRSQDGHAFDLRDCIDFRPFAINTANNLSNSSNWGSVSSLNPSGNLTFAAFSHIPSPDSTYVTDIQYYLPRIDKAALTTGGRLEILSGVPSPTPLPPLDSLTAMTLGVINVPPYPSLATPDARVSGRYDYAVTINLTQNQRYTMQDIGFLADRVEQLEYYSSLSLLEEQAQKALPPVVFQNGFVVDPFTGFNVADTLDPTFNCCIDAASGTMRPGLGVFTKSLWSNPVIPLNESIIGICGCDQVSASEITSCTQQPYNYCYGRIEFQPILFCSPDFFQNPDVVNNLANNANWVNVSTAPPVPSISDWRNPYGMDWRHWRHYAANNSTTANNLSGTTDIYGNVLQDYQSRNVGNTQNVITNNIPGYTVESIQIDTDIIDYTRCRDIDFIARGLKSNTNVQLFVGTYNLTNYVRQCSKGFAEETFTNYGANLTSDTTGSIFGRLTIPAGIFKEGSIQVTILDNANNITTRADGYLQTTFTDWTHWTDIDCTDEVANYEANSGVTTEYLPLSTLIAVQNTTFINERTQGNKDLAPWNTYFTSINKSTWQRFPSQSYTPLIDDDWNPTYLAQNGFRSFDRQGQDVSRITYGVVPSSKSK